MNPRTDPMIPPPLDALQVRLDATRKQLEEMDGMDADSLRRSAEECRRRARECHEQRTAEGDAMAERFEAIAVDIAMELDERTAEALLSGDRRK
ncbi:hypothetical protein [Algiphilus sp.]|uniref:hypothetical protein n=2 Tax=Algiphilus sp. TaxID=1872431 RepID=UPI0025C132D7|nr:hypothetical protein [Algiphilus sp.]MBY8965264.1 hypothetical protein [Algiphilus acroporae]MCI5062423.1 hypothetical protein [Algiphilus sp.]MCI5102531.1 hypothetical protein [Algiphilus sp.]MCR9091395.1 hypothetical protein [Pseudomonadota bacterium]